MCCHFLFISMKNIDITSIPILSETKEITDFILNETKEIANFKFISNLKHILMSRLNIRIKIMKNTINEK